ncbi:MAG: translation initiation factor aIF-1A [Candidatus Aenigmatarchaeota archaeon]
MIPLPKKKEPEEVAPEIPLPNPSEGIIVCGVIRHLGADYLLVKCIDGRDRKARIPGKIRRKMWIIEGDIVLVGLWGPDSDKCDVIHKYSKSEVNKLVEQGIIPKEFVDAISGLV